MRCFRHCFGKGRLILSAFDVQSLRRHRRDCLIATLLAPAPIRMNLLGLTSLDYEWGRTRHLVTEPTLGAIRLAWWRQAINQTARGLKPPHPTLAALADVFCTRGDIFALMDDLLSAHELSLTIDSSPDLETWFVDAGRTTTAFIRLWAAFCGAGQDMLQNPLIERIGRVRGAALRLFHLPGYFSEHICPLPEDMITRQHIHSARLLDFPHDPALAPIIQSCWQAIDARLPALWHDLKKSSPPMRLAGLLAHAVRPHIKAIKNADFHPFIAPDRWPKPDANLALRLLWARYQR